MGLFYQIPFYEYAGSLSLFFAYSDVDSGQVADFFQVSGSGKFFGARYTHALQKIDRYTHKAIISLEDKLFQNEVIDLATGQEAIVDPSRKSGGALHRLHCFCLEFDGACEVQRRVPTDWIIEPIDVSGYGSFSLAS